MGAKIKKIFDGENRFTLTEVIILLIIVSTTSIFVTTISYKNKDNNCNKNSEIEQIEETYNYILDNYYKKLDKQTIINGAIKGMLDATGDDHSFYLNDNESNTIDVLLEGSYKGLGIQVANSKDGKHIYITGIIENSPASKSNLKAGDEILSIDSKKFQGKTTTELVNYIKYSKNSKFIVEVLRDEKKHNIEVSREYIELDSVKSEVFEENNKKIGYIYISLFANNTNIQFKKNLNKMEAENIDSLIIDVRDNSGGHLTSVTSILSEFLDSSFIIYNIEDKGIITPTYSNGNKTKKYPIVVLINKNSASASEVLAGSLRDNLNAYLIGEQSFGKGTVQQLKTLSNGDYFKLTTQKWLTPKKYWINGKGLKPDLVVKLSEDYSGTYESDNQLQKALDYLSK